MTVRGLVRGVPMALGATATLLTIETRSAAFARQKKHDCNWYDGVNSKTHGTGIKAYADSQLRDLGPRLKASTMGIRSCCGVLLQSGRGTMLTGIRIHAGFGKSKDTHPSRRQYGYL